jgi:hypothetical protein
LHPLPVWVVAVFLADAVYIPESITTAKSIQYFKLSCTPHTAVWTSTEKDVESSIHAAFEEHARLLSLDLEKSELQIELWEKSGSHAIPEPQASHAEHLVTLCPIRGLWHMHLYIPVVNLGSDPFPNMIFKHRLPTTEQCAKRDERVKNGLNADQVTTFDDGLTIFARHVSAVDIGAVDSNGLSDPYVILCIGNQRHDCVTL